MKKYKALISVSVILAFVAAMAILVFVLTPSSSGGQFGLVFQETRTDHYELVEGDEDSGEDPVGENLRYRFEFVNKSDADITIENVQAGCSCTKPDYPKTAIPPSAKGTIAVQYHASRSRAGIQRLVVYLNQAGHKSNVLLEIDPSQFYQEHSPAAIYSPEAIQFQLQNDESQIKYLCVYRLTSTCTYDLKSVVVPGDVVHAEVQLVDTDKLMSALQTNQIHLEMPRVHSDQMLLRIAMSRGKLVIPDIRNHHPIVSKIVIPGSTTDCDMEIPLVIMP